MSRAIAKRYARALFSLAQDEGASADQMAAVEADLITVAEIFADREVSELADAPTLGPGPRRAIAAAIAAKLGIEGNVAKVLGLMADNRRLDWVGAVAESFRDLVDEDLGRVRATVTSAQPLSEESLEKIRATFEARLGKKVLAETAVDPDLLGGVLFEVGGRVWDGSIASKLGRLRGALSSR